MRTLTSTIDRLKPPASQRVSQIRQPDLVAKVCHHNPHAQPERIDQAYVYAMQQHGSAKRASGDAYFTHPLRVAAALADLGLDQNTVIAGLLHDVVEDTGATQEDIAQRFGDEVAKLVDGVTKLSQYELLSPDSKSSENLTKLLLAAAGDLRIMLIKLHDRLDNMRTLHFIKKPEKRRRIALETDEIYVPIAHRLGMQEIKEELEDLAFITLDPVAYDSIARRSQRLFHHEPDLKNRIIDTLQTILGEQGIEAEISGRIKTPASIQKKLEHKALDFGSLSDLIGFRLLVKTVDDCYRVLGLLHQHYQAVPGLIKDYISAPKDNGYQSLHTVLVGPANQRIEVQIRDLNMHTHAEIGVAAHWHYKKRNKSGKVLPDSRFMVDLKNIIQASADAEEAMELTKLNLYAEQVFCFTPKGGVIKLPLGATCLDFAYAVHSEIGYQAVGAKVNGESRPLSFPLKNGDQVEILTSEGSEPQPGWEGIARTGKARAEIRRFMRQAKRKAEVEAGRQMLTKYFSAEGYSLDEAAVERARIALNLDSSDALFAQAHLSWLSLAQALNAAFPESAGPESDASSKASPVALNDGEALKKALTFSIRGRHPSRAVTRAKCCQPLPGERIIGIHHAGAGIRIHTAYCDVLANFGDRPELWVDVSWKRDDRDFRLPARLTATLFNRPGAMATLTGTIGQALVNIANLQISKRELDFFEVLVDVEVDDVRQLLRLISTLRAQDDIVRIEREREERGAYAEAATPGG